MPAEGRSVDRERVLARGSSADYCVTATYKGQVQRKEVQEFSRILVSVIELVKLVKTQDRM